MVHTDTAFQILYTSQLAPTCTFSCVSHIITMSRVANEARGLTGALVFDGEYFCQLLEGEEAQVVALMDRIAADPRHVNVTRLFVSAAERPRVTRSWRSGYSESHQLAVFNGADASRGEVALAEFMSVLTRADME
jgi:hypothetical protein